MTGPTRVVLVIGVATLSAGLLGDGVYHLLPLAILAQIVGEDGSNAHIAIALGVAIVLVLLLSRAFLVAPRR